jgi:ribosomal protein L24
MIVRRQGEQNPAYDPPHQSRLRSSVDLEQVPSKHKVAGSNPAGGTIHIEMKIRLSELRAVIRRIVSEAPVLSTMDLKPGAVLRYTGHDMEKPNFLKVLNVKHDGNQVIVTAGDNKGQTHKISEKDLHAGEYEISQGMPQKKKPAAWDATR